MARKRESPCDAPCGRARPKPAPKSPANENKKNFDLTPSELYTLQQCGRVAFTKSMLQNILFDMHVCKLEGWDALEYPRCLLKELRRIVEKSEAAEGREGMDETAPQNFFGI